MSKTKRIAITVAISLIGLGTLISAATIISIGSELSRLNTEKYNDRTIELTEPFEIISIDCTDSSIYLLPSSDGQCTAVFSEAENTPHTAEISNGKLTVKQTDSRKWYDFIGISWGLDEISVTLYLPNAAYNELYIKTVSGDIDMPDNLNFGNSTLISTSGDIECNADISGELTAKTTSGDLEISGDIQGDAAVTSTSGDVKLEDMTSAALTAGSTSGNVELERVNTTGECILKTTSGDIIFDNCDAETLNLKSTSGDINGKILTVKNFSADTVSGDIDIPNSDTSAGECVAKTTSGDIKISIAK